jgi:hypothetical protein
MRDAGRFPEGLWRGQDAGRDPVPTPASSVIAKIERIGSSGQEKHGVALSLGPGVATERAAGAGATATDARTRAHMETGLASSLPSQTSLSPTSTAHPPPLPPQPTPVFSPASSLVFAPSSRRLLILCAPLAARLTHLAPASPHPSSNRHGRSTNARRSYRRLAVRPVQARPSR